MVTTAWAKRPMDRPTSVTLFAVFNICYGIISVAFVVFVALFAVVVLLGILDVPIPSDDVNTTLNLYGIFSALIHVALSALLLVTGAGLLGGNTWARRGSILYAKITATIFIIEAAIEIAASTPPLVLLSESRGTPLSPGENVFAFGLMIASTLTGLFIQLLHCGLLYLVMTRTHVIEWFEHAEWDGDDGLGNDVRV